MSIFTHEERIEYFKKKELLMNPPVEEWIACSEKAVKEALVCLEGGFMLNGHCVKLMLPPELERRYLNKATSNLSEEIRWREISIKEKYCE